MIVNRVEFVKDTEGDAYSVPSLPTNLAVLPLAKNSPFTVILAPAAVTVVGDILVTEGGESIAFQPLPS